MRRSSEIKRSPIVEALFRNQKVSGCRDALHQGSRKQETALDNERMMITGPLLRFLLTKLKEKISKDGTAVKEEESSPDDSSDKEEEVKEPAAKPAAKPAEAAAKKEESSSHEILAKFAESSKSLLQKMTSIQV